MHQIICQWLSSHSSSHIAYHQLVMCAAIPSAGHVQYGHPLLFAPSTLCTCVQQYHQLVMCATIWSPIIIRTKYSLYLCAAIPSAGHVCNNMVTHYYSHQVLSVLVCSNTISWSCVRQYGHSLLFAPSTLCTANLSGLLANIASPKTQ